MHASDVLADSGSRSARPSYEWDPYWEYGAFLDVRDLALASVRALECDLVGSRNLLVASSDITTSGKTSRELSESVHPDVEWRGGVEYEADAYRALIDIEPARQLLRWRPQHTWRSFLENGA